MAAKRAKSIVHKWGPWRGYFYDALRCNLNNYGFMPRNKRWEKVTCKSCLRLKSYRVK